ncbi:TetR/AcrR family transcriptional regulator [Sphingomonas rubra]|uniref:Transcriptional regulator, TetR family n=1 Tax=Sphingomonas rubra TaxID=634430 RepID=A0A1I5RQF5_9SPHN|nr:TetR/AcrR family transcriptional regulator [Sphingomonas rubra]SFP60136.1 transcriptional regulator, TetR family [Sphingomonas rubra]
MGSTPASGQGRRYAGASAVERRGERRERLIRAAIALYGERGYRQTTVTAVCRAAGLTPRYFYEAFAGSEALLLATLQEVSDYVAQHVAAAVVGVDGTPDERLRALLAAYYRLLRDDPASARVFLSEVSGIDEAVDALFTRSTVAFADLIARTLDPAHVDGATAPLARAGAMHGLLAIARHWVGEGCAEPVDILIKAAVPLCWMLVDTDTGYRVASGSSGGINEGGS